MGLDNKYLRGTISFIILSAGSSTAVTLRPDESRIAAVIKTIDYVFCDSFEAAYYMAEDLQDTLAGKPLYNLVMAGILHAEMTDSEDYSRKDELFIRLDVSKRFFQDWIKDNPGDPWGHFFLATVHAYKAVWHGQHRSWLKCFVDGLKAKSKFARAIELDPTLYDAYTGIGNYHFWSSEKLDKYLPLLPDNRERGLLEMRLAVDSSYFSNKPAATGLAWALISRKRFSEASRIGARLYNESSGGRTAMWILGAVYWHWGNLKKAERYYGDMIESLNKAGDQNNYNLIFCRYRRGVCLYMMKRYKEAKEELEILLSYNVSKEIRGRHKETYEKTRKYLKEIDARIKESP